MGQKWNNAPVFYTLSQVRFNPILSLEAFLPKIQEKMRLAGYPDFKRFQALGFMLPVNAPQGDAGAPISAPALQQIMRFHFYDLSNTSGFVLENNALSFLTTNYENYESFSDAFFKGLRILNEAVGLSFTERLGVRYLDAVIPQNDKALSDYLIPEVLGVGCKLDGSLRQSFSEAITNTSIGGLISRVVILNDAVALPPDLSSFALPIAEKFQHLGWHAIIDSDAYSESKEAFNLETLAARLNLLHIEAAKSFRATSTKYALQTWNEGN